MGWYADRQKRKAREMGFLTPSNEEVSAGAWRAGWRGTFSEYPTFTEIGEDMAEEGWWQGIANFFEWGYSEAGDLFIKAHNEFVREYQAAKRSPEKRGEWNVWWGDDPHKNALLHAEEYIKWNYQPSKGTPHRRREEKWGAFPMPNRTSSYGQTTSPSRESKRANNVAAVGSGRGIKRYDFGIGKRRGNGTAASQAQPQEIPVAMLIGAGVILLMLARR